MIDAVCHDWQRALPICHGDAYIDENKAATGCALVNGHILAGLLLLPLSWWPDYDRSAIRKYRELCHSGLGRHSLTGAFPRSASTSDFNQTWTHPALSKSVMILLERFVFVFVTTYSVLVYFGTTLVCSGPWKPARLTSSNRKPGRGSFLQHPVRRCGNVLA